MPRALETLKFAWVQYLALLVPSLLLFRLVTGFLFKYQIVENRVAEDLAMPRKH